MVNNQKKSLQAIHKILVHGRMFSYDKKYEIMDDYFDNLEYLVALILESENRTKLFDDYLKGFCEQYNLLKIYEKYKE